MFQCIVIRPIAIPVKLTKRSDDIFRFRRRPIVYSDAFPAVPARRSIVKGAYARRRAGTLVKALESIGYDAFE